MTTRRGPGLRKTRGDAIGRTRAGALVKVADVRWRELVEAADIVSEGSLAPASAKSTGPSTAACGEPAGETATWFGSTSIVLLLPETSASERAQIAVLAAADPHLRVRALRLAHREASSRAPAPLGRAVCELRASADPRGLRIDVDVQAPLIGVRAAGIAPGGGTPP